MACGTGKTFVALWVAEAIAKRTVLVLVPSLALLRQTLREWVKNTTWERFNYLCVCSDPSVTHGVDELVVRPTELEFPVKTDPKAVEEFLTHPFAGVKIIFSTYQSADVVARGMPRGLWFDIGIFDEAHKTAGREGAKFSFALKDKNLPIRKRLFLTATPRHYDLKRRDAEGEPVEVYSMNRPEIYGPVVHTLSFAEAAKQKIICNYKVVISVVTSEMLGGSARTNSRRAGGRQPPDNLNPAKRPTAPDRPRADAHRLASSVVGGDFQRRDAARNRADQRRRSEGTASRQSNRIGSGRCRASAQEDFHVPPQRGLGEIIHQRGERRDWDSPSRFRRVACQRSHVHGGSRRLDDRVQSGSAGGHVERGPCLSEGIDVPTVDMVAFLTPKRSKVDIVQAVGRAMRNAPGKTTGYILVPLYVEQAAGESLDAAVARAEFDEVWAVLQALQEQDEVLDDLIHQMQAERRFALWRVSLTPHIAPTKVSRIVGVISKCRVKELRPAVAAAAGSGDPRRARHAAARTSRGFRPHADARQAASSHRHPLPGPPRPPVGRDGSTARGLPETAPPPASPQIRPAPWTELGVWVDHVRALKRNGHLSAARQAQLDKLGFCWRVDGETLDSTDGLLVEKEFMKASGLTNVAKYRERGLIKPTGFAIGGAGLGTFYHPRQIAELKTALGITLDSTEGLLDEQQFKKASRLSGIAKYRKRGLIQPVGFSITGPQISAYYHPRQISELKKALGITLDCTEGLLNEDQFRKASGLTMAAEYRKQGIVKPMGFAMSDSGVSAYYHPRQIAELKKRLGITLGNTEGLLTEKQFIKATGLTNIGKYRKQGLIAPVGFAFASAGISAYYAPSQIVELRQNLGITLDSTKGLLNEGQLRQEFGLTNIAKYRKEGLIKPVGRGRTTSRLSFFYKPEQVVELKKTLGITLDSTDGLVNEQNIIKDDACASRRNSVTPASMMMTEISRPVVPGSVMSPKPVVVSAVTVK